VTLTGIGIGVVSAGQRRGNGGATAGQRRGNGVGAKHAPPWLYGITTGSLWRMLRPYNAAGIARAAGIALFHVTTHRGKAPVFAVRRADHESPSRYAP
jgi:hypothetical protein